MNTTPRKALGLWLGLSAIPALLLLIGLAMSLKMFPLYSGEGIYNADPAYAYLFNGLLLLDGHVPYHIDHPGTPLQALIAVLVYLQWTYLKLATSVNADIIVAVMSEPERYLLLISRTLLTLNVLALALLGKKIYDNTRNMYLACFCQCSLLTYGLFGTKLLYPAPEALVACLSLCLLGVLSPLIFQRDYEAKKQINIAILAGLIFGLGFAVKLSFLPMIGLFFLFKTWRLKLLAAIFSVVGWCIGIAPIMTKLPGLWKWAYNMMTHTGKYGGGSEGIVDTSQLAGNLIHLTKAFPFFYFANIVFLGYLLYSFGYSWYAQAHGQDKNAATAFGSQRLSLNPPLWILLIVCGLQTLIVLKHFGQHYMVHALPIAFIGIALLIKRLVEKLPQTRRSVNAILIVCMVSLIAESTYSTFRVLKAERIKNNHSVQQIQRELAKYYNPLVIGSYGCSLPQCGLLFGIEYAPAIDKKIAPFLANFYGFNVWNQMLLIDGHGFYPLSTLQPFLTNQRPIFLVTQIDFPAFDLFKKELILTAADQKLYKITGLTALP